MTGAYDSTTNHNVKGFKKILAGGFFVQLLDVLLQK